MTFDPDDVNQSSRLLQAIAKTVPNTTGDSWTLRSSGKVFGGIEHGQDSVSTAGTAVQLNSGSSLTVPDGSELVVRADGGNAGNIYVGDSDVTSSNGFVLGAGESVSLPTNDVNNVHIDSDNNGEGVSWLVETEA